MSGSLKWHSVWLISILSGHASIDRSKLQRSIFLCPTFCGPFSTTDSQPACSSQQATSECWTMLWSARRTCKLTVDPTGGASIMGKLYWQKNYRIKCTYLPLDMTRTVANSSSMHHIKWWRSIVRSVGRCKYKARKVSPRQSTCKAVALPFLFGSNSIDSTATYRVGFRSIIIFV